MQMPSTLCQRTIPYYTYIYIYIYRQYIYLYILYILYMFFAFMYKCYCLQLSGSVKKLLVRSSCTPGQRMKRIVRQVLKRIVKQIATHCNLFAKDGQLFQVIYVYVYIYIYTVYIYIYKYVCDNHFDSWAVKAALEKGKQRYQWDNQRDNQWDNQP